MVTAQPPSPVRSLSIILSVKIFITPEAVPEFFTHFKPVYDAVLAEPECLFFTVGTSLNEPGVISWTEGWTKGVDWFMNVQLKKDYYQPYLETTEKMFLKPRQAEIFVPLEGMNHFKIPSA